MVKNAYIEKNRNNAPENRNAILYLISCYFEDIKKHGYAETTVSSYRNSLKHLIGFLEGENITEIPQVTEQVLENFRTMISESGLVSASVAHIISNIRAFFRYLETEGFIFDSPAANLASPKITKTLGYIPSELDMIKLLEQPDTVSFTGMRDRALLETLYSTGIRLNELSNLKLSDVDLKNGTLRVFGKGKKERMVPLGESACEWLGKYLKDAREHLLKFNTNEDALWIGKYKDPMKHSSFGISIGKYSENAGIRRISPHAIRRACATHMLRNGAHPVQIQMMLGHSDLSSLACYLNVTVEDMKKTHRNSGAGK